MKPTRLMTLVLAASGAVGTSLASGQIEPFAASPPTTAQGVPFDPLIQSIRQAPDPSSAVNAFAAAQSSDRGDVGVEDAYTRRMVEFGLPEMADAQSQDLIRRQSTNGLAWGVAAYMSAKRGDMTAAATQADAAARRAPDEPFVTRTAAQMVAWYDLKGSQGLPGDAVAAAIESIRRQQAARPQFAAAYQEAKDALLNSPPETAPPQTGAQPAEPQPQVTVYPPPAPLPDDGGDVAYQPPIYISPAPYPAPFYYPDPYINYYGGPSTCWYPSYYSGCPTWWPTFGSFLFINTGHGFHRGFHDGHHDSHDGHHDGGRGIVGTGSGRRDGVGSTGVNRGIGSSVGSSPVTRAGSVSINPSARGDRPLTRAGAISINPSARGDQPVTRAGMVSINPSTPGNRPVARVAGTPDSLSSRAAPAVVNIRPSAGGPSTFAAPQVRALAVPSRYSGPSNYSMPAPSFSNSQGNFGGSSGRFSSSPSLRFGGSSSMGGSGSRFTGGGGSGSFSGGSRGSASGSTAGVGGGGHR